MCWEDWLQKARQRHLLHRNMQVNSEHQTPTNTHARLNRKHAHIPFRVLYSILSSMCPLTLYRLHCLIVQLWSLFCIFVLVLGCKTLKLKYENVAEDAENFSSEHLVSFSNLWLRVKTFAALWRFVTKFHAVGIVPHWDVDSQEVSFLKPNWIFRSWQWV